jgi:hypothetical protein
MHFRHRHKRLNGLLSAPAGVFCVALLFSVISALTVSAAAASASGCIPNYQSQGGYFRGVGFDNGTRAYISGTASNNSCGVVWFFVSEQSHPPTDTTDPIDGIQSGEIKEDYNFGTGNDCNNDGTLGKVAIIREYASDDLGKAYTCTIYQNIARSNFGSGGNFAAALGSNGWEAFYNSNPIGNPVTLGFSSGFSVARAEGAWTSADPAYDMTWGPSGQTPKWQYKTNSSGCCQTYTDVPSDAHEYGSGNGWNLGTPTNFHVTR